MTSLSDNLFDGCIAWCTQSDARTRLSLSVLIVVFRQTEVDKEQLAVFAAHDILGFHVQVQHALFVHICQRLAGFIENGNSLLFIEVDVLFDIVVK